MFEEYLKEIHTKIYHGTDDDMPDAFDNWLGEIDGEEYMKWAELFGQQRFLEGKKEVLTKLQ
jgi:hypothetical protein